MTEKNVILYVDDDEYSLVLFKEFMGEDYTVLTAKTTSHGYELLKTNPVKVLISDQRMPFETGLEFIERITPEFPNVIKIIYTAHLDHEAALRAVNQGGIFRYVLKPWDFSEMQQTLKNAVRKYDLRVENKNLVGALIAKNETLEKAYLDIKENEQKFIGIFQASSDGMLLLKNNEIVEVNEAFISISGMDSNFSLGYLTIFIKQNLPFIFSTAEMHSLKTEFVDFHNVCKYVVIDSKIFDLSGDKVILVILRDLTEKRMMSHKIMEVIFRTQEEDKTRYAQELHDGLGPVLSTVKMYVEWLCNDYNLNNREIIKKNAIYAIDQAIIQTKEIANRLSPHILQRFGLEHALKNHIELLKNNSSTDFLIDSKIGQRLSGEVEILLYRVLLECISNSLKHGKAGKICISIDKQDKKVVVRYTDDGAGFDVEKTLQETTGMGLFNLKNRIHLIGGSVDINSAIGQGTIIDITLMNN